MFVDKKNKFFDLIFFDSESEKNLNTGNEDLTICSFAVVKFIELKDDKSLIYDWNNIKYISFNSITDSHNFLKNLFESNKNYYLIAHNLDFDFKVMKLFNFFLKNDFKIKKFIYNSNFIFSFYDKNKKINVTCFDSFGIMRTSLKKIGEDLKVKKIEFDFNKNYSYKDLKNYNIQDVKVLIELFKFLITELKEIKFTIGSYSLNIFLKNFCNVKLVRNKKENNNFLMNICRGGDTEIFRIGKFNKTEKVFLVDINSEYPFIMKKDNFPVSFLFKKTNISINELKKYLNDSNLCVLAKLNITNNNNYGVFAKKYENFLIFASGKMNIYLCDSELKFIFKENSNIIINKIYEVYVYQAKNIFNDYIDFMYNKKKLYSPNNLNIPSLYNLYKILMNSLSGKFAQKEKKIIDLGFYDYEDGRYSISEFEGNKNIIPNCYSITVINKNAYQILSKKQFSYNAFPSIYAVILANSRMYLREIMIKIGFENIYYCDTDSLMLNEKGLNKLYELNLIDSDVLGKFKIENNGLPLQNLEIYGLKSYYYEGLQKEIYKIKGIKKPFETNLNDLILNNKFKIINSDIRNEIIKFLKKQKIKTEKNISNESLILLLKEFILKNPNYKIFKQLKFYRLGTAIINNDINNQKITDILKFVVTENYNKGIIQKDKTIKPFKLNEKIE